MDGAIFHSSNTASIIYADGVVYTGQGPVVDVSNLDAPVLAGTFGSVGLIAWRGPHRLLMMDTYSSPKRLRVLNESIFAMVDSVVLPDEYSAVRSLDEMLYLGGDALALLTEVNGSFQLVIMHMPMIGNAL